MAIAWLRALCALRAPERPSSPSGAAAPPYDISVSRILRELHNTTKPRPGMSGEILITFDFLSSSAV
jgi:hypothetical protein